MLKKVESPIPEHVKVLKDKFTKKRKLSHYFHTPMQSRVKFHSPQNISGL